MASFACQGEGKASWPELVGTDGKEAVEIIESENTRVDTFTIKEGSFVTADFRCDRVRVWVDKRYGQTVTRVPRIG